MKQIYIGFSRSSKTFAPFSWLIMWAEGIEYSHVYIKTYDEELQEWIYYQSSHDIVNTMTEPIFLAEEIVVHEFEFQVSDQAYAKMKKFVMDNMGKPYGVAASFGMAYQQILRWMGFDVSNPFKDVGQEFVCSQFAAAALDDLSDDLIPVDLNGVTPKDMFAIVSKLPKQLVP